MNRQQQRIDRLVDLSMPIMELQPGQCFALDVAHIELTCGVSLQAFTRWVYANIVGAAFSIEHWESQAASQHQLHFQRHARELPADERFYVEDDRTHLYRKTDAFGPYRNHWKLKT